VSKSPNAWHIYICDDSVFHVQSIANKQLISFLSKTSSSSSSCWFNTGCQTQPYIRQFLVCGEWYRILVVRLCFCRIHWQNLCQPGTTTPFAWATNMLQQESRAFYMLYLHCTAVKTIWQHSTQLTLFFAMMSVQGWWVKPLDSFTQFYPG